MAIGHLSVRVGTVGKAQPHAAYIARVGQYAHRLTTGECLEHSAAGNMPAWAQHDPLIFWQAADQFERANGSTYREYEIALPRELNPEQRLTLVQDFIKNEVGQQYAYQFAIHTPRAADGHEQPHCHLMFCERRLDGIERDPDQFFKRYNTKHPERGGAKKDNTGLDHATRQEQLKALRQRWEHTCNDHLTQAGCEARIDMRSYHDQHSERIPEPKQHPKRWKDPQQRAVVLAFRATQQEQEHVQQALKTEIKNPVGLLVQLEEAQQRRDQLKPEAIQRVYKQLLAEASDELKHARDLAKEAEEKATALWSASNRQEPQAPTGLLAGLWQKGFLKAHATWQETNQTLYNHYIAAARTHEQLHQQTPQDLAAHALDTRYPTLAAEKKRLEHAERERVAKERQAQREQQDQERQVKREQERVAKRKKDNDRGWGR